LIQRSEITFEQRSFHHEDINGRFLVFACTGNRSLNESIAKQCRRKGVLCNIADQPEIADFIVPASFSRGNLTVAVSTGGGSPALSKKIRRELEDCFGEEYEMILQIMARLRPCLLALDLKTEDNTAIFRRLVNSDLLKALREHRIDEASEILKKNLPAQLRDNIPEFMNGFV
jgi:precorrin-2 dehydrogenase/sirohydrochlorin ferrochelatase